MRAERCLAKCSAKCSGACGASKRMMLACARVSGVSGRRDMLVLVRSCAEVCCVRVCECWCVYGGVYARMLGDRAMQTRTFSCVSRSHWTSCSKRRSNLAHGALAQSTRRSLCSLLGQPFAFATIVARSRAARFLLCWVLCW